MLPISVLVLASVAFDGGSNPHIVLDELYGIDRGPMTFDIMRSGNICIE